MFLVVAAFAAAGCADFDGGVEISLEITPASGPSGTVADVQAEASEGGLRLDIAEGSELHAGRLDDDGRYSTTWEFTGEPGDTIELSLALFTDSGEEVGDATAEFTITEGPGESGEPEDTDDEAIATGDPVEAEGSESDTDTDAPATAAVDVEVTVDPASGPAGENATVTVKGAPNAPVTVTINGVGTQGGTTDANGEYTFQTTFNGDDGDEVPVEAEVGVGADTRAGSATYTIDNPETACTPTAEDLTAEQFHETANLDPALIEANALSSIRVEVDPCEFAGGTFFVAISDSNSSGTVDDGDTYWIAPQPADGNRAEMGIDAGGNYFIGIIRPGGGPGALDDTGMPATNPTQTPDGWQLFESSPDVLIEIIERGPDDPTPAYWNVDFGDPLMAPQP